MNRFMWVALPAALLSVATLLADEATAAGGKGGRSKPAGAGGLKGGAGKGAPKQPRGGVPGGGLKPGGQLPGGSPGRAGMDAEGPGQAVGRFSSGFGKGQGPGQKPDFGGPFGQDRKPGAFGLGGERGPWKPGSAPLGGDSPRPRAGEAASAGSTVSTVSTAAEAAGAAATSLAEAAHTYNYDVNIDADVDVNGSGWYPWGTAPAYAYQVAVPNYASAYGIVPTYYSWYYPPASSASVTYITSGDGTGTQATTYTATGETVATEATSEQQPYSESVTTAMQSLQDNPDASERMLKGSQLFRDRRYADASDQFRRAIPLDPDNGLPRFSQAHAMFALGDYDNASYNLRRGLDLMPEWTSSGNNIRALYGSQSDFTDHLTALSAHLCSHPEDGEALAVHGYVLFFTGNLEGAEIAFRTFAESRPEDPLGPHFLEEIGRIQQHVKAQ